jgi:hypothetical protein
MALFYEVVSENGYFSLNAHFLRPSTRRTPAFSPSTEPPVEQGGGESVLNLLGEVFRRSQDVTDKKFIAKLEQRGLEYSIRRIDTATVIEVGRFCYRFNEQGQSRGGWIRNYAEDRRSEWEKWAALLNKPID